MIAAPVSYFPKFMDAPIANGAFSRLLTELAWVRRDSTPRMEYYVNRFNVPYTYGKGDFARTYEAMPPHPVITGIQDAILREHGATFDVCFLNRYVDQSQHLGWHSDDSPEMDDARPIAIVSFGVEREIHFRRIPDLADHDDGSGPTSVQKLVLGNGSLCLMAPGMQDAWQHRIPKCGRQCGERISLTFRGYVATS